jgi:hypothetical protein
MKDSDSQGPEHYPQHDSSKNNVETKKSDGKSLALKVGVVIVIFVLVTVLYILALKPEPGVPDERRCSFKVEMTGPTSANLTLGWFLPEHKPTQLEFILVRNGSDEGRYTFQNDDDGVLSLSQGTNVETLTYEDLEDDQWADSCDLILMANLAPGSNYSIIMFWGPTGDQISRRDFSTPG